MNGLKSSAGVAGLLWPVSVMLLMTVAGAYVLANATMLAGYAINPATFPLAAALAAAFTLGFKGGRNALRALVAYVAAVLLALGCAMATYDYSWDGIMYHQEIIALLADGWNPFRTEMLSDRYMLWTLHYAKAIETVATTIVSTFGPLEIGKAVNFMLLFATLAAVSSVLKARYPQWRRLKTGAVALAIVCSPVVIGQLHTYYIDYTKYTYLLWTLILVWRIAEGTSWRRNAVVLAGVIILAIGTKFNIFFEEGLWVLLACAWYLTRRRKDVAARLFATGAAALTIGLVLTWHPYVTNTIVGGHPFYPLMGEGKVDIMTDNTPALFGHGRIADFFISIITPSWPGHEQRIGGFGPLMPLILLCSAYVLIKLRRSVAPALIGAVIVCLASCFFFEQTWWARYIAQLWLVPAIALFASAGSQRTRKSSKLLLACMLLTIPISMVHGARSIRSVYLYRSALYEALANDTVTLINTQPQFEKMLREHDVHFRTADHEPANPDGDIMFMFGYGDTTGLNTYPLLALDSVQTHRVHRCVVNNKMKYDFFRYRTSSAK